MLCQSALCNQGRRLFRLFPGKKIINTFKLLTSNALDDLTGNGKYFFQFLGASTQKTFSACLLVFACKQGKGYDIVSLSDSE
jgi:hypothetical protein